MQLSVQKHYNQFAPKNIILVNYSLFLKLC